MQTHGKTAPKHRKTVLKHKKIVLSHEQATLRHGQTILKRRKAILKRGKIMQEHRKTIQKSLRLTFLCRHFKFQRGGSFRSRQSILCYCGIPKCDRAAHKKLTCSATLRVCCAIAINSYLVLRLDHHLQEHLFTA